jgi:hypothetical protein
MPVMPRTTGTKQKLSRSKIELFTECPRCFWLDVKKGVKRPPGFPFTLNNAVDYLLKQEFDEYRAKGKPHPLMTANGVDAIPFAHEDMDKWRHNFTGVQYAHEPTGFLVTGAVDDIWKSTDGALHVVDYKATGANEHKVHDSYRRQMEIYQWLLRRNGFDVSPVGYFVFAKASKGGGFSTNGEGDTVASLPFNLFIEPSEGSDDWVETALMSARKTFDMEKAPDPSDSCEFCTYRKEAVMAAKK